MVGRNFLAFNSTKLSNIIAPNRNDLDLKDRDNLKHFLQETQPDIIIHAAGKVGGIQANISNPLNFFLDNLIIGQNLILTAKEIGITKLINLGSSCMYPKHSEGNLTESQIFSGELEPTNEAYALAKVAIAKLCQYISTEDNNYKYKTIVPCNLYGKHDKYDPLNSHLIPAVINKIHQAIKHSDPIVEIWGDGTARREFMYAGDFADALSYCINNFDNIPMIMNIGLGFDFTVQHYYQTVAEVLGYKGQFRYDLSKPTGMVKKVVDVSLLKSLGWEPKTTLHEGISKTYTDYLLSNGKDL